MNNKEEILKIVTRLILEDLELSTSERNFLWDQLHFLLDTMQDPIDESGWVAMRLEDYLALKNN